MSTEYVDFQHGLAVNLENVRRRRGMTLSGLAEASGIAKATLSNLSRGKGNPTLETIWTLAHALQVPFGELVGQKGGGAGIGEVVGDQGASVRLIERQSEPQVTEAYLMKLDAQVRYEAEPHPAGVEERIVVLQGYLLTGAVSKPILLSPGDSTAFAGDVPHVYEAANGPVSALVTVIYPDAQSGNGSATAVRSWPTTDEDWNVLKLQLQRAWIEVGQGLAAHRIRFHQKRQPTDDEWMRLKNLLSNLDAPTYVSPVASFPCRDKQTAIVTLPNVSQGTVTLSTAQASSPLFLRQAVEWAHMAAQEGVSLSGSQRQEAMRLAVGNSLTLATLAAEALTRHGCPTVPGHVAVVGSKRGLPPEEGDTTFFEHRINVDAYAAFELIHPAYARQVVFLAAFLDAQCQRKIRRVLDVGTGPGLPLAMLLELCPDLEVTAIEPSPVAFGYLTSRFAGDTRVKPVKADFLDLDPTATPPYDCIVSVGASHHLNTAFMLQQAERLLAKDGLLLIADEMLSPFLCAKTRRAALIRHHLAYVVATLVDIQDQEQSKLHDTERDLINWVRNEVPQALFEAVTGNAEQATIRCRRLLEQLRELDLPLQPKHPLVAFYRFHLLEIEALVAGLDYEVERKTFPRRFVQLAQHAGFEMIAHARVYATDGPDPFDAGTHVFAFRKAL
ncbi:MAG: methyltransferase [Gammaproteobacteria bacterium]